MKLGNKILEELNQNLENISSDTSNNQVKLLTNCPTCQQGLSRYENDTDLTPQYIIKESIQQRLGENWQADIVAKLDDGGVENVLL